jgi:hypothetical protein
VCSWLQKTPHPNIFLKNILKRSKNKIQQKKLYHPQTGNIAKNYTDLGRYAGEYETKTKANVYPTISHRKVQTIIILHSFFVAIAEEDKCCREHDYCSEQLTPGETIRIHYHCFLLEIFFYSQASARKAFAIREPLRDLTAIVMKSLGNVCKG